MRRKINTEEVLPESNTSSQDEVLKGLVESYIENKDSESYYKDLASSENTQIKELMRSMGISECESSMGTAVMSEQNRETFIEEALIEFLKNNNIATDIVKTKEYVDFDALESAIYNEKISPDLVKQMASCKEVKTTTVLRIKKKKGL